MRRTSHGTFPTSSHSHPGSLRRRVIPGAAAPRRARRRAVRHLRGTGYRRRLGGRTLHASTRRSAAACPGRSGSRAASTSTRSADLSPEAAAAFGPLAGADRARDPRPGRRRRASTSTAGATAARTSTSGSCRARSACSRRRTSCCRSGRTCCRTCRDEELARGGEAGGRRAVTHGRRARPAPGDRRRGRHRARLDDRRGRLRGVRARGRGRRQRAPRRAGARGRRSPTATRSHPRSSPPSTRPRAARTSTAGSGSGRGGASSPAGAS